MGVDPDKVAELEAALQTGEAPPSSAENDRSSGAVMSVAFAVGTTLAGRYRVVAPLGEGGMGAVYRVHDQQLGEDVALKLVTLDSLEAKERFRREVKLARRITHPNVARTHDIGEHEGRWFLTMELIGGGTLEDRLAEGPLPLPEAASIGRSLALGLAAAHDVAVVHRDLKPGNVMLEPAGSGLRVVITDFGIARSLADEGPSKASRVVGTPLYMAPEQLLGETVTPASDVYALGLLLFEMLTGELPFEGSTPMASVVARCREAPRDPRTLAQVPDPIADLILACLQLEPERRPPLVLVAEMLEAWSLTALAKTRMGTLPAEYASFLRTGFDTQTPVSSQRISTPFAPISIGERRLAVLPFRYRGPSDHDYLGESLTQELIDVLSRTRGLKVLAFGASETEQRERNPRAAGERLGVQTVVDGDVLAAGPKVRVSVRMLDVQSGVQLWTDRFEGELEDIFRMQDIVSQRISEALRVELDAGNVSYHASAETSQDYLRARRDLHSWRFSSAMALLERCLERDPDFGPALAAHALCAMRLWWFQLEEPDGTDWGKVSEESVARALAKAPDLAETHLAAGMFASQRGRMDEAVRHLATALDIAPAFVAAHRYLGELQCEAGRVKEGLRRLELVLELDPSATDAYFGMSRIAALEGRWDDVDRLIAEFSAARRASFPLTMMRTRLAAWRSDFDQIREIVEQAKASTQPMFAVVAHFGRYLLGEGEREMIDNTLAMAEAFGNPRMLSMVGQLSVEALCTQKEVDRALALLERIASDALVDVAWLEGCPLLEVLRQEEGYRAALSRVRSRADALWRL